VAPQAAIARKDEKSRSDGILKNKNDAEDFEDLGEAKSAVPMMAPRALGLLRGRLSTVSVRLAKAIGVSSGANTAYSTVVALSPGGTSEFSSFAAIFDEVKCTGFRLHWTVVVTAPSANGTPQMASAVMSFDPTTSTALSNILNGMESDQSTGPHVVLRPASDGVAVNTLLAGVTLNVSTSVTKTGYWMKQFKIPSQTALNPATSAEITGGAWVSTQDTTAVVGYLKPYVEALGANIVANIYGFTVFDVVFRSRR
jgi:hypothetical protein